MNDAIWQRVLPLLPACAEGCRPTDFLQDDLGLDSLDCVELVLQVERSFDIRFSDPELEQLRTVQDLLDGIERHLQLPVARLFFAQLLSSRR
jgi:acyl carrier protein